MYVPDFKKWVSYYANVTKENNNPFLNRLQRGGGKETQIGGSLSGSPASFMVPIGSTHDNNKPTSPGKMSVNMISPAEQTVQMAKKQLNRKKRAIKRKNKAPSNHSAKRTPSVRTTKKTKNIRQARHSKKTKGTSKSTKVKTYNKKPKNKRISNSKKVRSTIKGQKNRKQPTTNLIKAF